ncbi:GntR family transcriptional regulator [Streptacidiphilus sp. N1-3]|uniref:GntR family transcriptional regulator n=1 Tax=Streptacidiphilus alkalitolerans TaxID=3342712 RepID=A0ABV6XBN5_9ACTN
MSKYQRLAADLRRRIRAGEWQGGEALPVETELEAHYDVARNTVRLAMDVLVNEGLVVRVQGKGTYLKDHPVLDHHAYVSPPGSGAGVPLTPPSLAYATEAAAAGRELSAHFQMLIVRAATDIAERLQIAPDEVVVLRRVKLHLDGEPWAIEESNYPLALAVGTALMDPDAVEGGDETALHAAGHVEVGCVDEITGRMPDPDEAQWFQVGPGVPLLVQARTGFSDKGPVRVTRTLHSADRSRLVYHLGESRR